MKPTSRYVNPNVKFIASVKTKFQKLHENTDDGSTDLLLHGQGPWIYRGHDHCKNGGAVGFFEEISSIMIEKSLHD